MQDKTKLIQGGKGPKQQAAPPPPVSTADNLRSQDTVEVILGLCEGPIEGLERGDKSFYVGDTQLQNENGEYNFQTFRLKIYPGFEDAEPVKPTLGGTTVNSAVNVNMFYNTPITREGKLTNIDFIDVRLLINSLYISNSSGTFNNSLVFRMEYKALSSPTWIKAFDSDLTISGKTTSAYLKEYRFAVPSINEHYELRLTKLTGENTTESYASVTWESFQETIAEERAYNNTAIAQLTARSSDQFSSIPSWSGIYKLKLIKIPSNYDPIARTYTGVWDGTFQIAWSNNPAWCLYDFVTDDRSGIASHYPNVSMDKYDVYEAARWCDELVPDGKGGFQPRYTFNTAISDPRSGMEFARYMAGTFNAVFFDDLNGVAYLRVDKDDAAAHIFTKENVFEGDFEYSYTDMTSRYNDFTVTFINESIGWDEDRRRVFDQEMIDKNGRIPLDFIAVGCLDAHEARRRAQYKLITANTETCIVSFKTNRLGQFVNPFDVILISDPDMGYGISGRIKTIATEDRNQITLRDPVYLEAGIPYVISFVLKDGTTFKSTIQNSFKGYNYSLQFTDSLPPNVPERTVFTLEHPTLLGLPRPFRVTKIVEEDGNADMFSIEAININRNKWYAADNLETADDIQYSVLPDPLFVPGPINVNFNERYVKDKKEFQLVISPVLDRGLYKYYASSDNFEVWSRLKSGSESFVKETLLYGDTMVNHDPGLYEFKVLAKSYLGSMTSLADAPIFEFNVTNPKDPPKDIDWARVSQNEIYWGYENPPEDFMGFQVRYHNREGRTTWNDAIQPHIGYITQTSFYTSLIPPSARVILIAAFDDFETRCVNPIVIYRGLGDVRAYNVIEQVDYHPTWAGTKEACFVEPGTNYLVSEDRGDGFYSGTSTAYMYDGDSFYSSTYEEMMYYDVFTVPKEGKFISRIDFEGAGYELNLRKVGESIWQPIPTALVIEEGDYEIRLRLLGGPVRGKVKSFSVLIDVPDIVEDIQDVEVGPTGIIRLPLTQTYSNIKLVNVIIQASGGSTATNYQIIDKDPDLGPEIILYDNEGNPTSGLIDAQIKGY